MKSTIISLLASATSSLPLTCFAMSDAVYLTAIGWVACSEYSQSNQSPSFAVAKTSIKTMKQEPNEEGLPRVCGIRCKVNDET